MGNNSNIIIREAHRPDIPEIGRIMSDNYHDTYADILDRRYMASVNPDSCAARMDAYYLAPGNAVSYTHLTLPTILRV